MENRNLHGFTVTSEKELPELSAVLYVSLYFDADCCTEEELSYLSFACGLLGDSDTAQHSAEEIINKTRLLCGIFYTYPVVYTVGGDPANVTTKLCVTFSTLESKLFEAAKLVTEVITQSKFTDEIAHDILRQTKMNIFQRIIMSGNSVGLSRIAAQSSPAGVAEECIGGVAYHEWLKKQDEIWDFDAVNKKMQSVLEKIVNKNGLTVSITGVKSEDQSRLAAALAAAVPERESAPKAEIQPWGKRKEGIAIPADIAFAVMGGNLNDKGGRFSGQLQLAGQIISLGYLWNAIRVQGGAYGAGMVTRDTGLTACYSYRDPNGAGSVESYRECAAFLREFAREESDFTGFIIGTVANGSPLMTPKTKAQTGDKFYFSNTTWEDRCRIRKELLGATAEDLLALADALEKTVNDGGICMVGGKEQLDQCGELESVITL